MLKVAIVGASGYSGAQLVHLLSKHKDFTLSHLYVSERSLDLNARIDDLYGQLRGLCSLSLEAMSIEVAKQCTVEDFDVVFLATEHTVSYELTPIFLAKNILVIDLSGAFRLSDYALAHKYYGISDSVFYEHMLSKRVYALVDFVAAKDIEQAQLLSMPGCYTTTSELALKPLTDNNLLDTNFKVVINAVSGVSGAGRKAKLQTSVCEVSLNAYGLFHHRHTPEIEEYAACPVIFNPHLGNFKRGILATITARLASGVRVEQVEEAYIRAYGDTKHTKDESSALVRFKRGVIRLADVQNQPFCDISFESDGEYIVISSALDNLLKGAASQAIEALNIHYALPRSRGLI